MNRPVDGVLSGPCVISQLCCFMVKFTCPSYDQACCWFIKRPIIMLWSGTLLVHDWANYWFMISLIIDVMVRPIVGVVIWPIADVMIGPIVDVAIGHIVDVVTRPIVCYDLAHCGYMICWICLLVISLNVLSRGHDSSIRSSDLVVDCVLMLVCQSVSNGRLFVDVGMSVSELR